MPKLIKGEDLDDQQKRSVLDGFHMRWTFENEERARKLYALHGGPPQIELMTDNEWLKCYAFWFNKDGRMTGCRSAEWIAPTRASWEGAQ